MCISEFLETGLLKKYYPRNIINLDPVEVIELRRGITDFLYIYKALMKSNIQYNMNIQNK